MDNRQRKRAFRTAFDFMELWISKIPAYVSPERFWADCAADYTATAAGGDELTTSLMADAYMAVERVWKAHEATA